MRVCQFRHDGLDTTPVSFRHFGRSGTDAATTRPLQERTAFLFYRRIDLCQTHRAASQLALRQLFKSQRRLPREA